MPAAEMEATIPFRKTIDALPPMDRLFERLQTVKSMTRTLLKKKGHAVEKEQHPGVVHTIQQAADLHNRSVGNMASKDFAEFMDHTWTPLRPHVLYTLADYYKAIESMVKLTAGLPPNVVFVSFQGLRSPREQQGWAIN